MIIDLKKNPEVKALKLQKIKRKKEIKHLSGYVKPDVPGHSPEHGLQMFRVENCNAGNNL